jgi:peptide/nickel transport system substrate-binding protein
MSKRLSKLGWIVVAVLLSIALIALPACGGTPAEQEEEEEEEEGIPYKNDGIFIQETIGDIDSLDPAWAYDTASGEQIQHMYEGLVGYDGGNTDKFLGLAADTWTIAPDGKSITFHIRPNVKFSNGDTMTVNDALYSFQRVMVTDPYSNGGPIWMFYFPLLDVYDSSEVTPEQIQNAVQIVNGDSIKFNFVRAYPSTTFMQILSGSWGSIVNKKFCIEQGDWPGTWDNWKNWNDPEHEALKLNDKTMGTGPFALEVWNKPTDIKLVKNQNYWQGTAAVPFDRVITKYVDEWSSRKLSLLAGDADLVYCPRTNIGDLAGIAGVQAIKDLPELSIDCLFFNFNITATSPYIGSGLLDGNGIPTDFFTDINVRRGITQAFNWDTYITQAMQGEAQQVGSPIVDGLPYFNPNAKMYSYDVAKATEDLKAAWGGQVWEKGFKFTLIYNAGNLVRKTACEILAENLQRINTKFQVSIQPKVWSGSLSTMRSKQWAMFQIGWLPDYADPDNYVVPFMATGGTFSGPASYSNPVVDALIAEGATSIDTARRQQIYYQLQDIYYTDVVGIPLAQPLGRRFFTKYIDGFIFNPCNSGPAGNLLYLTKSAS